MNNNLYSSPDGITWTILTQPSISIFSTVVTNISTFNTYTNFAYGNGYWVFVIPSTNISIGKDSSSNPLYPNSNFIFYTTDLINFKISILPNYNNYNSTQCTGNNSPYTIYNDDIQFQNGNFILLSRFCHNTGTDTSLDTTYFTIINLITPPTIDGTVLLINTYGTCDFLSVANNNLFISYGHFGCTSATSSNNYLVNNILNIKGTSLCPFYWVQGYNILLQGYPTIPIILNNTYTDLGYIITNGYIYNYYNISTPYTALSGDTISKLTVTTNPTTYDYSALKNSKVGNVTITYTFTDPLSNIYSVT